MRDRVPSNLIAMAFRACRAINIFAIIGMIRESAGHRINFGETEQSESVRKVLKATPDHVRSQKEQELPADHVDAPFGRLGVQKPLQEPSGALEGRPPSLAEVGHSSVEDGVGKKGRPWMAMALAAFLARMDLAGALSVGRSRGFVPDRSQFSRRGQAPLMSTAGHAEG